MKNTVEFEPVEVIWRQACTHFATFYSSLGYILLSLSKTLLLLQPQSMLYYVEGTIILSVSANFDSTPTYYLPGKRRHYLQGCQTQISQMTDILTIEIFYLWIMTLNNDFEIWNDFKLAFRVNAKFNFPQGSLENVEHQFLDRFYFIICPNLDAF